jgi:hypothetical protein
LEACNVHILDIAPNINVQDNDGWPDVTGAVFTDSVVLWMRNKGGPDNDALFDGTYIPLVFPDGPCTGAYSTTVFDWNNDGWLDIGGACR